MPPIAILAGGLATRLRPKTLSTPKSMIEVAGAPFIQHQLRLLVREGFSNVVLCIGHFGEQIEHFVGDGSRFGCSVRYSRDGEQPLGTGGALARALQLLGEIFMVIYGDSYLDVSYSKPFEAFCRSGLPALMTVYRNEGRWDTSNVDFSGGLVKQYDKTTPNSQKQFIDYGLGIVRRDAFTNVNTEVAFDLAMLYSTLARRGMLAGYEVHQRFYEIGSPSGLSETEKYLRQDNRH